MESIGVILLRTGTSENISGRRFRRIETQIKRCNGFKPSHVVNEKSGLNIWYDVSDSPSIPLKAYFTLVSTECNSIVVHISMSTFVELFNYCLYCSYVECDVPECDRESSTMKRPWPTTDCRAKKKIFKCNSCFKWKSMKHCQPFQSLFTVQQVV
jgi:hypothetical protein